MGYFWCISCFQSSSEAQILVGCEPLIKSNCVETSFQSAGSYNVAIFRIRIMLDELELIIDSVEYEEVSVENAILQIR